MESTSSCKMCDNPEAELELDDELCEKHTKEFINDIEENQVVSALDTNAYVSTTLAMTSIAEKSLNIDKLLLSADKSKGYDEKNDYNPVSNNEKHVIDDNILHVSAGQSSEQKLCEGCAIVLGKHVSSLTNYY